jgi:hypothetical protein
MDWSWQLVTSTGLEIKGRWMKTADYDEDDDLEAFHATDPNDPRTMECGKWAALEVARLSAADPGCSIQIIRIEPNSELRAAGASFIGSLWLPTGQYHHPNPAWAYHCAVLSNGIARDEMYPNGLPLEAYKRIFMYWDDLAFTPVTPQHAGTADA